MTEYFVEPLGKGWKYGVRTKFPWWKFWKKNNTRYWLASSKEEAEEGLNEYISRFGWIYELRD